MRSCGRDLDLVEVHFVAGEMHQPPASAASAPKPICGRYVAANSALAADVHR
jgi:hypothetical protein